ncbi:protein MOS2-like [Corylus avellana]|uniref:protein MOS2-like n=1 Tax=Corylus avellana TaxID=13451 RepID=UPI001E2001F3|nr:protein MOS2-like [Corylus avellana]XP_059461468.1 protein MOS2-like [Corylus avellana]XP_059461469.1 protein MOS2-like [Corylus avellana]XP_059461470.1 protein MOS2-like [Corylus avellana]
MKFSLQSKSSAKPKPIQPKFDEATNNDHQESKHLQFITQFDASETLARSNQPKNPVIPPIPNQWRPHKRMKNLELPITSKSDASGALSFELESQDPSRHGPDSNISYGLNLREKSEYKDDGERLRSTAPVPVEAALLQKLKDDLDRLPEHRGMEEFDDVPVEGFGAALLAGYGWHKGRGIGRNAKVDVKVVQYEKRADKHGLGFISSDERDKEEEAKAKRRDTERRSSNAGKQSTRSKVVEEDEEEPKKAKAKKSGQVSWLKSHIRVRIISKQLKGGRLYLKKGEVVDVVGPTTCDISIDESRELIQGVSQDLLETALPRRGGPVLVLYGKHEGVYGNLVRRDLEQESGLVQDANNHELLRVPLEQIAEYIGDPSCLGY